MRATICVLCAVCLLLAACESPTDIEEQMTLVELKTDRSVYAPGDSLTLHVTNRSVLSITYNFCGAGLYGLIQQEWVLVSDPAVCSAVGYHLPPGSSAEWPMRLPSSLGPGTYRFVDAVSIDDTDGVGVARFADLTSTAFVVQ